ncbi:uncharacterized protein LOC128279021 [Anopheles cruzii]|uniref:uncharacterized protein LOC128279021 n=1 Tax=Anopheles cruzii TaxID=68878 RepID=UPI0022EC93C1|nr:uncharacterized protein LOC128279021 [Anopheles cruzii]
MLNVRSCRQRDGSLSTVALLLLALNVCHLSAGLASPTTAYDSLYDPHGRGLLPVRAESPAGEPQHGDLADEPQHPVQQQLLGGAAGSVTRVPWYGLTEVTDIVLLAGLVAVAVIGAVVFVVLVISLRTKFQTLRAQPAERGCERSAAVKGGESRTKAPPPQCKGPPIVLIETVKPVSVTCVTVKGGCETYEPTNSPTPPLTNRPRIEQPLSNLSDKHGHGTVATTVVQRKQHPPPEAVTMSALGTTLESTNQLPSPVPTASLVGDDKENCLQPQSTCDALSQHHPSNQRPTVNVLKRQPVAEISLASSGPPTASPTAFIQLLTPSSASSISTGTTTDNNATPTKTGGTGGPGGPLSASESMAAARFGFSPRSIHSFTVQTATYFRFPDVDDFTPTPRTTLHPKPAIDDDGSSSTPPAVDAFSDPAERDDSTVVAPPPKLSTHPPVPAPPSVEPPEQEKGQAGEEPAAATDEPVAPPEGRTTSRICAPMANRRVRLKSISLDSEGARLVEENLTSTIPVQELVGMAQQRGGTGGTTRFDCVLDDEEDDGDESNNYETDGDGWPRTKRVRNILNLRLNIPPLGGGGSGPSGALPLAIGSQSTGSMVETATATMVSRSVTTSVSNPAMVPTHHQHQPSAVLAAVSHHQHQQRPELESNEQFYFEYFDYGDDDETDDEYDEDGEEFEDNNNNSTNHSRARPPALPTAPKTPTLSQSKQKASSLDSDSKVKISVPYGVGAGAGSVSCSAGLSIMSIAQSTCGGGGPGTTLTYSQQQQQSQQPQYQQQQGHGAHGHFQQQPAQHQGQLQPRRVSSASVPTTPKRYQYRTAVNHHYHQYHHHHQQQQQQHYPSGQSKLMKAAYDGPGPGGAPPPPPTPATIARKDKSPIVGGTKSGANDEEETGGSKAASTASTTTGRSASILQRRGSNHSLTLNLDIYHRGGSVDLTGSNCSLHRGSYKNLHQAHSQSQLYQQYPDSSTAATGGGAVRVQCHQASPQGGQSTALPNATHNNNNNNSNNSHATNGNKKNLLQRRGSNTSLTLNLRTGVVGGGSTFGLNRFSSHNSLNTTHMTVHGALGGPAPGAGGMATGQQQQPVASSLVRPAGSKKSLLERRNSNASLTLINVHQRTLSVSNCNLRGSICSLNSLLTTHTQNEAGGGGMMLEEDELDCTGAATGHHGDGDHHHNHHHHNHHHHHHQHHQHQQCHNSQHHGQHGHHRVLGGRGGLAASVDGGIHETDGGAKAGPEGAGEERIGRLTVAASQGNSMECNATSPCGDQDQVDGGLRGCPRGGNEYRQRKFRSSDSLHNINTREHCLSLQQPQAHREAKLMATGSYQRCCQSSYDERHLYGSSENFKQQQNKLSTHRALFHKDPSLVTSASSANNLSALGTTSCCCCCCCCCAAGGGADGRAGDGCCDANGLIVKTGNLSISNSNIRNISTKPLSPQTTSEDFKIYLANIQFLQNASNVLTIAYLRKLHNFFTKTYRKMVTAAKDNRRTSKDQTKEQMVAEGVEDRCGTGTKMMLMHSDSLHHPPVCDDESYDEEHKKMVLKIHQEFWDLPTNYQEKPLVFGSQAKNRYKTILPNEHSRVILEPERAASIAGEPYINANFIKGPDYANNSYIATQGPLPNTIYEFWLMVHQNIVRTAATAEGCPPRLEQKIVMLTNFVENGRQKCAIYFPQDEADWLAFGCTADVDVSGVLEARGDIAAADTTARSAKVRVRCTSCFFLVQNIGIEQRNGYTVRTLAVTRGLRCCPRTKDAAAEEEGEEGLADFELSHFRAQHYWFPDWPDHRSPNDINVLLDLSLDVLGTTEHTRTHSDDALPRADPPETPCVGKGDSVAPGVVLPIIHCSAGIGRTGCLIAILNGLRQLRLSVLAHRRNVHKQHQPEALLSPVLPIADGSEIEQEVQLAPEKTRNPSDDVPAPAQAVQDTTDAIHSEEESELEKSIPLPPVPSGRRCGGGGGSLQRESGQVDILGIVCNLRLQRGGMVQNSEQYELIHRALCLYLEKLTREEPA